KPCRPTGNEDGRQRACASPADPGWDVRQRGQSCRMGGDRPVYNSSLVVPPGVLCVLCCRTVTQGIMAASANDPRRQVACCSPKSLRSPRLFVSKVCRCWPTVTFALGAATWY